MQSALEVARAAGLELRQRGGRYWVRCPLHGEKTASFCIFPDGKWKCFGCGAHGDAADLYAALHGVSLAEALRACKGEWRQEKRPSAHELRRVCEAWRSRKWAEACERLHAAQGLMDALERKCPPSVLMALPVYWEAVEEKAHANDTLNMLDSMKPEQMLREVRFEQLSGGNGGIRTTGENRGGSRSA